MGRRRQLLNRLETVWQAFRESYAGLADAELTEPGVTAAWSVKDVLAHVTTWEEEALKHLPLILEGGTPPRYSVAYGGIDAFNARTTEENRKLALSEVLRRQDEVHRRLVDLLQHVPEAQLAGDTRFRRRLRLDTYGHYAKHARAIWSWRRAHGSGARERPA